MNLRRRFLGRRAAAGSLFVIFAGTAALVLVCTPQDTVAISIPTITTNAAPVPQPAPSAVTEPAAKPVKVIFASCHDRRKLRMGYASWYGESSVFDRTANGEKFNEAGFTAASRMLPFNTHLRVTNLRNGRSVVVRVNDRGPFRRGRVIDVTPAAAAKLGMKRRGLAPVYIEILADAR